MKTLLTSILWLSSLNTYAADLVTSQELSAWISGTGSSVEHIETLNPQSLSLLRSTITSINSMDHANGGLGQFGFQIQPAQVAIGTAESPVAWLVRFSGTATSQLFDKDQGCADATVSIGGRAMINVDSSVKKVIMIETINTQMSDWGNCL